MVQAQVPLVDEYALEAMVNALRTRLTTPQPNCPAPRWRLPSSPEEFAELRQRAPHEYDNMWGEINLPVVSDAHITHYTDNYLAKLQEFPATIGYGQEGDDLFVIYYMAVRQTVCNTHHTACITLVIKWFQKKKSS